MGIENVIRKRKRTGSANGLLGGLLLCGLLLANGWLQASAVVYSNDFSGAKLDGLPEELLLLDGDFAVKEEGGNRFLELPGTPLETFGVLFGPNAKEGQEASARIYGTNKGRRYPAFGLGLNGVAGFRLFVAPAKRRVELYRSEDVVAHVPYRWSEGEWTRLLLQVVPEGGGSWKVRGKVWPDKSPEPEAWTVEFTDTTEPFSGNASVWGKPFAGTPIRFDDFLVRQLDVDKGG